MNHSRTSGPSSFLTLFFLVCISPVHGVLRFTVGDRRFANPLSLAHRCSPAQAGVAEACQGSPDERCNPEDPQLLKSPVTDHEPRARYSVPGLPIELRLKVITMILTSGIRVKWGNYVFCLEKECISWRGAIRESEGQAVK